MRLTLAALFLALPAAAAVAEGPAFCDDLPRKENASLALHPASTDWFEVREVEPGIFGILEPHQWQQVISWLVIGSEQALLIDTGNGIGDIAAVVRSLTDRPVTVINTHSHYDHVGGNYQFPEIAALRTDYGVASAAGKPNAAVRDEASAGALCQPLPPGVTAENHVIRPFSVVRWLADGYRLDIGGREIELLAVPGHSPDSIALLDRTSGLLWTGDTYYPGDIWLFDPDTDYAAYYRSIERLAALAPMLEKVLPAHDVLVADPADLVAARDAYRRILRGELQATGEERDHILRYEAGTIGFLLRADHPRGGID